MFAPACLSFDRRLFLLLIRKSLLKWLLEQVCEGKGVSIVRNLIGPYITSLEMQGASITLLKADDEILKFWDAPVNTPGLRWGA